MSELQEKQSRVSRLLDDKGLDAVLLTRQANFNWFTGGHSNFVAMNTEFGVAHLLISREKRTVLTTRIEGPRMSLEELADQGYDFVVREWYEPDQSCAEISSGMKVGCDAPLGGTIDITADVQKLRYSLTAEEVERFRGVGADTGATLQQAMRQLESGMSEFEIAAVVAKSLYGQSLTPVVLLVATDERIFKFRHPIPTSKKLDKYCMVVVCGRREGLIASATRFIHFGRIPETVAKRQDATAQVDACFIGASKVGAKVADIFAQAVDVYKSLGFTNEWRLHHQGGPTGYQSRDYLATPTSDETVRPSQAYAWNPSITGTKSEDTIIAGPDGPEIITAAPDWPMIEARYGGVTFPRPAILEV